MRRILVTGAATWTGSRLIQVLERRADVLVAGVDELQPRLVFTSRFRNINLDHPDLAAFVLDFEPDTVVHLQTLDRSAELGRARAHEETVVGSQALFGAIAKAETSHIVVKSDAAIYGAGARNPSILAETAEVQSRRGRYARALSEVERSVEETRQRLGLGVTVLRFASIVGPQVGNPISRLLALPAVPTVLGFDPRLQFIYEQDAAAALEHAVLTRVAGTFNVAGHGQTYLSRVLRLGGRLQLPMPKRAFEATIRGLARLEIMVPDHVTRLLQHGRVLDTTAMRDQLKFEPVHSCRDAVLAAYGLAPVGATP